MNFNGREQLRQNINHNQNQQEQNCCIKFCNKLISIMFIFSTFYTEHFLYYIVVLNACIMLNTTNPKYISTILTLSFGAYYCFYGNASILQLYLLLILFIYKSFRYLVLFAVFCIILIVFIFIVIIGTINQVYKSWRRKKFIYALPRSKHQVQNNLYQKQPCSICLDQYQQNQQVCKLPCNHIFHFKCIQQWLKKSWLCPVCRGSIDNTAQNNQRVQVGQNQEQNVQI